MKKQIQLINGMNQLLADYKGFILDAWGVIWNGVTPFPNTKSTLQYLLDNKKQMVVVSNSPRTSLNLLGTFEKVGLPKHLFPNILTSGQAVVYDLQAHPEKFGGKKYYHFGSPGQIQYKELLDGLEGFEKVTDLKKANFVLNTDLMEDYYQEDVTRAWDIIKEAHSLNMPWICTNPDKVVMAGSKKIICPGTLADMYKSLQGSENNLHMYGKPYPQIYRLALELMKIKPNECCALGDALETDIQGAQEAGMKSVFVWTGIHAKEVQDIGYKKLCGRTGFWPDFTLKEFKI